jgi:Spy/CpxP family protein refolding chaperone
MKTTKPLLLAALAVMSLGTVPGYADTEKTPAASDSDRYYESMQERYRLMQEQMNKIRQTQDPAERQKLMQEYWQTQQGAGMMGGHGYGMGPGMMGGGYGYGGGMGPGMMGGYGMGPGMGGGYGYGGMGPGMMGYGFGPPFADLSAEQQGRIAKIQDETRKKQWQWMGMMMDEQAKLRDMYNMPKRDSAAIGKAYEKMGELQRQMFESSLDAHKRMEAVLTKEQRENMRRNWHRGGYPGY